MAMNFFKNCKNVEQLKREYRQLAMLHHPDRGGDLATMQQLNSEYELAFAKLKNIHENVKTGQNEESSTDTKEQASDFMDIIDKIINYENIDISIVGTWIWVAGDTKPIKDILKSLKFFWNAKRELWMKKPDEDTEKHRYSKDSSEQLKGKYGCEKIKSNNNFKPQLV